MNYKKYTSIENLYRDKYRNYIIMLGYTTSNILYQVTEKIHGANFQFIVKGKGIFIGKKTSLLIEKNQKKFYRSDIIFDKYKEDIKKLSDYIKTQFNNVNTVRIYGELFGGAYQHPDVEKNNEAVRVQKGIWYCPFNDFAIFDISIESVEEKERQFLNQNWVVETVKKFNLKHVPVIATNLTFDEAIKIPNDSLSQVYKFYDLPEIKDNIIEGVVIKPVEPLYLNNGDRVILKNKNEKHSENNNSKNKTTKTINMTKQMKEVYEDLQSRITENRLKNVISHIGHIKQNEFGKLLAEMNKDVIEEHIKESNISLNEIKEKNNRKVITKMLNGDIATLIRKHFVNIVDGEF